MAATVRHSFVSAITNNPASVAAGKVAPSYWNENHVLTHVANTDVGNTFTGNQTITGNLTVSGELVAFIDSIDINLATRTEAIAATISGSIDTLQTGGYATSGDGGGATYKRVGSEPAHAGKFQSADGAWWELAETIPDVRMFGAVCDGTTDDLAAWNGAVGWTSAMSGNVSICHSKGSSRVTGPITPITSTNVWVLGSNGSTVVCPPSGVAFQWGAAAVSAEQGGMDGIRLSTFAGSPDATQVLILVSYGARLRFSNIFVENGGTFAQVGESALYPCAEIRFNGITGYVADLDCSFIDWEYGNGAYVANIDVFVAGVSVPAVNQRTFFTAANGSLDTAQFDGLLIQLFKYGILMQAGAGIVIQNITMSNAFFDSVGDVGMLLVTSSPTGVIVNFRCDNVWFTGGYPSSFAAGGRNLWFTDQGAANGPIEDIAFTNSVFMIAGLENVYLSRNCRRISFTDCRVTVPNGTNAGHPSVYIQNGALDCQFIGGYYNCSTISFVAITGTYAFIIEAETDRYNISNLSADGISAQFNLDANTTGSKKRRISGLTNPDYAVAVSGGVYVLPASTVAWTNKTPFTIEVFLYSGTVTVVAKNGVTVSTGVPISLRLDPGETYTVTYSVAPTVTYAICR